MQRVIFDSSFLMAVSEIPTTWREDIASNLGAFEPILLDCVRKELESMSSEGKATKKAKLAGLSLELAAGFKGGPCGRSKVDDEIASAAQGTGAAVATTDGSLAELLRRVHVTVITLRGGRVAVFQGRPKTRSLKTP